MVKLFSNVIYTHVVLPLNGQMSRNHHQWAMSRPEQYDFHIAKNLLHLTIFSLAIFSHYTRHQQWPVVAGRVAALIRLAVKFSFGSVKKRKEGAIKIMISEK